MEAWIQEMIRNRPCIHSVSTGLEVIAAVIPFDQELVRLRARLCSRTCCHGSPGSSAPSLPLLAVLDSVLILVEMIIA